MWPICTHSFAAGGALDRVGIECIQRPESIALLAPRCVSLAQLGSHGGSGRGDAGEFGVSTATAPCVEPAQLVAAGLRGGSAEQGTFVPDGARFRGED